MEPFLTHRKQFTKHPIPVSRIADQLFQPLADMQAGTSKKNSNPSAAQTHTLEVPADAIHGPQPTVQLIVENDQLKRIRITCPCGQTTELECTV